MLCDIETMSRANQYLEADFQMRAWRWVYGIALGAGAIVSAIGVILLATVPSERDVDAGARAELRVGPGGLVLDGSF